MISRLCIVAAIVSAIAASAVTTAGAGTSSPVVPRDGKIAGYGYPEWLSITFQVFFKTPPGGSVCQSVITSTGPVAVLIGGGSGKTETHACTVPAGRPIDVLGFADECSTLEPPPYHGTTPAQLTSCARKNLKGTTNMTTSIDSTPVADYASLIAASPVYTFDLPKHNVLGSRTLTGQSAAYGEGLLLTGLTKGTHTIHVTGALPGFKADVTYTLHVT